MTTRWTGNPCKRDYQSSGLHHLKRVYNELGGRTIDPDSDVGRGLAAWRESVKEDLGGELSAQEESILDVACRSWLILSSIDTWILTKPKHLVNERNRHIVPAVRERSQIADSFLRYMSALGMRKRKKNPITLTEYVSLKANQQPQDGAQSSTDGAPSTRTVTPTRRTPHRPTSSILKWARTVTVDAFRAETLVVDSREQRPSAENDGVPGLSSA